jgi:hypothetical protein
MRAAVGRQRRCIVRRINVMEEENKYYGYFVTSLVQQTISFPRSVGKDLKRRLFSRCPNIFLKLDAPPNSPPSPCTCLLKLYFVITI